jgi:TatD DNase family protein
MELIDSHCHLNMLDLDRFEGSLQRVIDEANQKNVTTLLTVSVDLADHAELVKIAQTYPNVYISAGTHPNEHPNDTIDSKILESAAQHPKVIAIGETGLDYYRSQGDMTWQKERFIQHISVAKCTQKPLIIHTRMAKEDTLSLLREEGASDVGGVMHCFTEDWETAKQALDLGFYISFSGIVTFKNAVELQEVAKKVPLSRMLVETDSPYLAPIPHRGKPNCPAYVYYVAEYIASLRNVSIETIAKETTHNFLTLFKI